MTPNHVNQMFIGGKSSNERETGTIYDSSAALIISQSGCCSAVMRKWLIVIHNHEAEIVTYKHFQLMDMAKLTVSSLHTLSSLTKAS